VALGGVVVGVGAGPSRRGAEAAAAAVALRSLGRTWPASTGEEADLGGTLDAPAPGQPAGRPRDP
jgi:hypothetical protein